MGVRISKGGLRRPVQHKLSIYYLADGTFKLLIEIKVYADNLAALGIGYFVGYTVPFFKALEETAVIGIKGNPLVNLSYLSSHYAYFTTDLYSNQDLILKTARL